MAIDQRIGVLGIGKLGRAIAAGLLDAKVVTTDNLRGTTKSSEAAAQIRESLSIACDTDNAALVAWADVIILGVKPYMVHDVMHRVRDTLQSDAAPSLIISIAAGVNMDAIESQVDSKRTRVLRAMTNTPSLIREAMTVIARGSTATDNDVQLAMTMFEPLGRVMELEEKHVDVVTALAASGPAFVYTVVEALADGGVRCGLPRAVALELAAQMTVGAARMVLETGRHPASLRDDVSTPGGCTVAGLKVLEAGGVRAALADTIEATTRRASELG